MAFVGKSGPLLLHLGEFLSFLCHLEVGDRLQEKNKFLASQLSLNLEVINSLIIGLSEKLRQGKHPAIGLI